MASREELLQSLATAAENGTEEPVVVLVSDLTKLSAEDLLEDVEIEPVEKIDENGTLYPAFGGRFTFTRGENTPLLAFLEIDGWRKYWTGPLGVEEYHHLVRQAVEARQRFQGDVELLGFRNEDVVVAVDLAIALPQANLREAVGHAKLVQSQLLEAAEAVSAGVVDLFETTSKRLQGWGSDPLEVLVDRMREGGANEKGLTLEELTSRLFARVPGFTATGRVATETEEVDISIQNASDDELWRRESFLLIAECKNWSGTCGKNEFVLFERKLVNRTGRVTCGFLVSWNGFAETVTAEMLRGTQGNFLVIPVTGADLRGAVRDGDFPERLKQLYHDAVYL